MNEEKLRQLRIASDQKRRSGAPLWIILAGVTLVTGLVIYFAVPRASDSNRSGLKSGRDSAAKPEKNAAGQSSAPRDASGGSGFASSTASTPGKVEGSILTVSGYIINRERIELSPRFMGVVKWIGVKKGDAVTNGQVVARLDDAEYQAHLLESEGRSAAAKVALEKAELEYDRVLKLYAGQIESKQVEDNARLGVAAARAMVKELEGQIALNKTYLDWCIIKSPIDGVVLEKLVDPNELVSPQSFGGTRGPSTAFVALGDLNDLQVQTELNEADLSKVFLNQQCKISPEAYPDKSYEGFVAEIAPEANRQKGTLEVKVQIKNPDRYLTPELSAKVDFLKKSEP